MHAQRRMPWNRGLSTAALKDYEYMLEERISQLVNSLLESKGNPIDLGLRVKYFAYVT